MTYQATLTYRGDKTVNLVIPDDQLKPFFDTIRTGDLYLNEEIKVGFWTSMDQILNIIVQPQRTVVDNPEENEETPNET